MRDCEQKNPTTGNDDPVSLDTSSNVSVQEASAATSPAPESASSDFYDNLAERFFDFLFFESLIP